MRGSGWEGWPYFFSRADAARPPLPPRRARPGHESAPVGRRRGSDRVSAAALQGCRRVDVRSIELGALNADQHGRAVYGMADADPSHALGHHPDARGRPWYEAGRSAITPLDEAAADHNAGDAGSWRTRRATTHGGIAARRTLGLAGPALRRTRARDQ